MSRLAAAALCALAALPLQLSAQDDTGIPASSIVPMSRGPQRAALGLELSFLVPRGDFAPGNAMAVGYGLRGALGLDSRGVVDIGAAFRSIAHDSQRYGDTVEVSNMLRTLALSGQLTLPLRYLRPYVGGSLGAAYFGTETQVERCCDDEGEREWQLDGLRMFGIRPMASARLGILVDIMGRWRRGQSVVSIDLGVEDHYGREGRYQVGGRGRIMSTGTSYRVFSLGVTARSR